MTWNNSTIRAAWRLLRVQARKHMDARAVIAGRRISAVQIDALREEGREAPLLYLNATRQAEGECRDELANALSMAAACRAYIAAKVEPMRQRANHAYWIGRAREHRQNLVELQAIAARFTPAEVRTFAVNWQSEDSTALRIMGEMTEAQVADWRMDRAIREAGL